MSRSKRFGEVLVQVDRQSGEGVGSRIVHGDHVYRIPQWPARVADIEERDGGLAMTLKDGTQKMLDPRFDAITESAAGGSAGGHHPAKHGKIRYIVRSFGKWANGKHSVCVRRITTEHPEVAAGKDVNALCAWLKDQWAGTTKWRREPGEDKKSYKAREKRVIAAARESAAPRLSEGLKWLTDEQLDAMVEDVKVLTGVHPVDVLHEVLGGGAHIGDPNAGPQDEIFEAIWQAEVEANATALTSVVIEARDALREEHDQVFRPLLEEWLALHGDGGTIREDMASVKAALQRAVRLAEPDKFDRGRSEIERRVMECQRGVYPPGEEDVMEAAHSTTRTMYADPDPFNEEVVIEAGGEVPVFEFPPLVREVRLQLREAGVDADERGFEFPEHLKGLPQDRLREIARDLYESTGNPTPEGRIHINRVGPLDLAQIIVKLEEISKPGYKGAAKKCAKCGGAVKKDAKRCQNCESGKFREAAEDAATIDQLLAVGEASFERFERSFNARNPKPIVKEKAAVHHVAEADTRTAEEIAADAVAAVFSEERSPAQRAAQRKASWSAALSRAKRRNAAPSKPAAEEVPEEETAEETVEEGRAPRPRPGVSARTLTPAERRQRRDAARKRRRGVRVKGGAPASAVKPIHRRKRVRIKKK